jgi:CheY-like chemotaxis protein
VVEDGGPVIQLKGITVLLIDDDRDSLDMVRRILEAHQAEVIPCSSAKAALEAFESRIPTVVVCDIRMPGMDGFSFVSEFRKREQSRGIRCVPALALTGIDETEAMGDAARAGFQIYIQKPIDPVVFVRSIAKLAVESPR